MKKDIILMGIAGCGKGTQARLLLDHFGEKMKYFEMGITLRTLQSTDNAIGNYLARYTPKGLLIKPAISAGLRTVFMETLEEGDIILGDGTLRTLDQTIQMVQKMWDKERRFVVICLDIPDEEVYKRLAKRVSADAASARNDDTNEQAIKNRINLFYQNTEPALKRLDAQGVLVRIDGMRSETEIFKEILSIIEK